PRLDQGLRQTVHDRLVVAPKDPATLDLLGPLDRVADLVVVHPNRHAQAVGEIVAVDLAPPLPQAIQPVPARHRALALVPLADDQRRVKALPRELGAAEELPELAVILLAPLPVLLGLLGQRVIGPDAVIVAARRRLG